LSFTEKNIWNNLFSENNKGEFKKMSITSLPTLRGINIRGLMAQLLNLPKAIQSIMSF